MDPKSFAGKPPKLDVLNPEFGSRLSAWILEDMRRAKKAREERAQREAERKRAESPLAGSASVGPTEHQK